jgi:mono/diheme cytochrome c family protein
MMAASLLAAIEVTARAEQPPDFSRDIRPVLEQHCFKCHGSDKQKGGLRLDQKASVLKGGESGEPAIVPGDIGRSHLLQLIVSTDPDEMMPPKGERLKAEQVALLNKWVETGAHWIDTSPAAQPVVLEQDSSRQVTEQDRKFWSFVAPQRVSPPRANNSAWARGDIDRIVVARLESRGLHPSPEAPPAVLIRRLSFDLTGLPPTPEEVETFLRDSSPAAYENLVDRLLASARFGEKLASPWLPLARYAEDQAHQVGSDTKFFYPNAWRYRKWIIDAFNRNLPYDQFLKFQLAADKFDEARPDDLAALGFLGLGPKYYNRNRLDVMADEWEDRVDTTTRTMLGLTVACARCHDHKFDPIPSRDYYALAGVFASTRMVNETADRTVQKGELVAEKVDAGAFHAVMDAEPKDLNVFIRGNVERKGPVVPRHFLTVLSESDPAPFREGSGRKELAMAIASRTNPLTARVMVNRLWGMLFGRAIVQTPSNFGHSGQPPTNQALLDYLAVRFMDNGWSIKSIVREMVLSSTYRQSAQIDPHNSAIDAANESMWRMNRRRLTIEQWRDSVLFVSGQLEDGDYKTMELDDPKNRRRTVYARVSRLKLNDLLMQFDYPDANVHSEKRSVTSTPMQKLFMLNSAFVLGQAKAFAARLSAAASSDKDRIELAYKLLFAREPGGEELALGLSFVRNASSSEMSAWEQYAQILLASNEALYLD